MTYDNIKAPILQIYSGSELTKILPLYLKAFRILSLPRFIVLLTVE